MNHGEVAVLPVGEGGAFVAVGDGRVFGHNHADFLGAFRGYFPDNHGVGAEPGTAVVEDGAVATHELAFLVQGQLVKQFLGGEAQALGHGVERPGYQREVFLGFADDVLIPLGDFLGLVPVGGRDTALPVARAVGPAGVRVVVVGVAAAFHHVKVDADFEEADGGHDAEFDGVGFFGHPLNGGFQVAIGGDGEGEPEVVVGTFAGVVVADAGVAVDVDCAVVQVAGIVGESDQRGLVTQASGIEDGANLADDVLAFQFGEAGQNFVHSDSQVIGDGPVGLWDDGEIALHDVEQFAVGKVHGVGSHRFSPVVAVGRRGWPVSSSISVKREL